MSEHLDNGGTGRQIRPPKHEEVIAINMPKAEGTTYETCVPDTLDLVERARLGLRHFLSIIDATNDYEMPLALHPAMDPPKIRMHLTSLGAAQAKAIEAMCYLRLMTGSTEDLDREARMMQMYLSFFGDDGLHWVPGSPAKSWLDIPEPFVMIHGQGRIMRAMIAWYQYTGNSSWKQRIDRLIDGIDRKLVVHKDDYAYVPTHGRYEADYLRSCYVRRGWRDTAEPTSEKHGEEGSLFNHQGHLPGAMATWYTLTGNDQALRLSGELVRFYTKRQFWADWDKGDYPGVFGAEHAHWRGHFHGYVNVLRAILEYALATNDLRLKQFVRDGYEWARQGQFARIGLVGDGQGCGCGRLIGLAVKLSRAGVGDYWEDVDQYIRNHGTEMQMMPDDVDYLRNSPGTGATVAGVHFRPADEDIIERSIGGFGMNPIKKDVWLCCSPHGNMGLFYAWDGTLESDNGTVKVNLLLNRASTHLDIDSYLPYEGKVVLRNKRAREILLRLPLWADRAAVRATLNGNAMAACWHGRYLRAENLQAGDILTVAFPMVETTQRWHVPPVSSVVGGDRICRFRGNTLVEINPPLDSTLYRNRPAKFNTNKVSSRKVTRHVTEANLRW